MRDAPGSDRVKPSREAASVMRFAGLVYDLDASTLARDSGEAISLTRGEFALLRMFVTRPRRVVGRDTLDEVAVSEIDEPHDSEDEAQPPSKQGIEAAQQDSLNEGV
jgi:DNA-binding response OmpR family regulator